MQLHDWHLLVWSLVFLEGGVGQSKAFWEGMGFIIYIFFFYSSLPFSQPFLLRDLLTQACTPQTSLFFFFISFVRLFVFFF